MVPALLARLLSILVVLDVVLEAVGVSDEISPLRPFNPCCAGCSSGSLTFAMSVIS